jgi:hypothetical protein
VSGREGVCGFPLIASEDEAGNMAGEAHMGDKLGR